MKKLFAAVLVAAMLVCASAIAEVPAGWNTITMPDVGMQFSIPGDMETEELTAEDVEEGCAWAASNEMLGLAVYVEAAEGSTLDDYAADLAAEGLTVEKNSLAGAGLTYDHVLYSDPADSSYVGVIFMGNDGCFYTFEAEGESDEAGQTFGQILSTIAAQ